MGGENEKAERFEDMGLDMKVLRACQALGFTRPTPVQAAVVPAALSGRDVLAAAPTGSGKTAAYLLPVLHRLVSSEEYGDGRPRALVLVPTRELAFQVAGVARSLLKCAPDVSVRALAGKRAAAIGAVADVVVATPSALAEVAKASDRAHFEAVVYIVVDEADLVLSYGYDAETRQALAVVPTTAQAMLVSATLGDDIDELRKVVLRKPMVVKVTVEDGDDFSAQVTHNYTVLGSSADKYLVTYALLRLKVLTGKTLIFTRNIDSAFRLKLFLDKFSLRSATLNAELPLNSRVHCVEQFNAGVFDLLIACEEGAVGGPQAPADDAGSSKAGAAKKRQKKQKPQPKKAPEYGLSRGIDFQNVSTVLNFDVPHNANSYMHRAGRTARAGRAGLVLSLVDGEGSEMKSLQAMCRHAGVQLDKLTFKMDQVEAFRYRVEDTLRAITSAMVLDARLREVKREMLNSEKLRDYFDSNPKDLEALRHEKALASKVQPHLADVPSYLLPPALREKANAKAPNRKGAAPKRKRATSGSKDPLDSVGKSRRRGVATKTRSASRPGKRR